MAHGEKSVSSLTINELSNLIQNINIQQTIEIKKELSNSIQQIYGTVQENNKRIEQLETKIEYLERRMRRNNIAIFGLSVKDKNHLLEETLQALNTVLQTNFCKEDINNIFFVNKDLESSPVILEFISLLKKQTVFQNIQKLKGTGLSIANDASHSDRQKKKVLVGHLKSAREQNLTARIKGFKLEIDNQVYSVEELKALEDNVSDSEEDQSEEVNISLLPQTSNSVDHNQAQKIVKKRKLSKVKYSPKTRSSKKTYCN